MPTSYRQCRDDERALLPHDMREWLPEGHLAYVIRDTVADMDLTPFHRRYEGDGRRNRPYDPRMMVTVLVYAYAMGVFSSRRIERKMREDVAFRLLGGGLFPHHRTICAFRQAHLGDFEHLFLEVVRVAREAGIMTLGTVTVDGTKVRANASKRKAMSHHRLVAEETRLAAEIAALVERARAADSEEDGLYGKDARGDELPDEIARRETRLETLRAARARLEARQRAMDDKTGRTPGEDRNPRGGPPYKRAYGEPDAKAQANFTDPDSRIMKTSSEGFQQCYNAQVAVDGESQMIVATEVVQEASDHGQLDAMVERVEATTGGSPGEVLADAGYCSEEALVSLEERGVMAHVAVGREGRKTAEIDGTRRPATRRMAERMASAEGKMRYARRKWMAEAPHGWIKEAMGFRRFGVRGLNKVRGEWHLVCLALNLRRLATLSSG